jgi:hypothetical protein
VFVLRFSLFEPTDLLVIVINTKEIKKMTDNISITLYSFALVWTLLPCKINIMVCIYSEFVCVCGYICIYVCMCVCVCARVCVVAALVKQHAQRLRRNILSPVY